MAAAGPVTLLEQLRAIVASIPPGGAVTLPRDWLAAALADLVPSSEELLTVRQAAQRFGRSPSTVRGWCHAGRFPGAVRLSGRDWRIPAAAAAAFWAAQHGADATPPPAPVRGRVDLGAWRSQRRRRPA